MASSRSPRSDKIIVDSIHGDIHLNEIERRVIDTASFQRLRHLKQLGMAQVTYPNATHTRFAHSIGVLGIMARITDIARDELNLDQGRIEEIRLAGLLHDVGHYPEIPDTHPFVTDPASIHSRLARSAQIISNTHKASVRRSAGGGCLTSLRAPI